MAKNSSLVFSKIEVYCSQLDKAICRRCCLDVRSLAQLLHVMNAGSRSVLVSQ